MSLKDQPEVNCHIKRAITTVVINLIKAETAYNHSGSKYKKLLKYTLYLTLTGYLQ